MKNNKKDINLTESQKIRLTIARKAVKSKNKLKAAENLKVLRAKNRIETGFYDLKDVQDELLDCLLDKLDDDE